MSSLEAPVFTRMSLHPRLMKAERHYGENAVKKEMLSVFELVEDPDWSTAAGVGYPTLLY